MGKEFIVTSIFSVCEAIPSLGYERVPDPKWEYISPSGIKHIWVGDEIPTLEKKIKQVPAINWLYDDDGNEWPIETEETDEISVYIDPETDKEIKPGTYVKHVYEYVKGITVVSCEFGIKSDKFKLPYSVDIHDCEYPTEDDRALLREIEIRGKWNVLHFSFTTEDNSPYAIIGKAVLSVA